MAEDITKTIVTKRDDSVQTPTLLPTPSTETANVVVVPLAPWKIALIRTARVYLQSLVGFLTAGATGFAGAVGVQMPIGDFTALLATSAGLAVAPAAITLIQNAIELLAKLDSSNPTLRA